MFACALKRILVTFPNKTVKTIRHKQSSSQRHSVCKKASASVCCSKFSFGCSVGTNATNTYCCIHTTHTKSHLCLFFGNVFDKHSHLRSFVNLLFQRENNHIWRTSRVAWNGGVRSARRKDNPTYPQLVCNEFYGNGHGIRRNG